MWNVRPRCGDTCVVSFPGSNAPFLSWRLEGQVGAGRPSSKWFFVFRRPKNQPLAWRACYSEQHQLLAGVGPGIVYVRWWVLYYRGRQGRLRLWGHHLQKKKKKSPGVFGCQCRLKSGRSACKDVMQSIYTDMMMWLFCSRKS